ncbi:cytochrome c3 family protein [Novosphingobium aquae]|uniref:Cytochrome c3 family protein n=1 Tax=Novosphingobium aquae TaxID=3133435 RepID=A0ABU8SE66_9SPHN
MSFRLKTVETTAQGREIVRLRDLPGDSLTLGRSADCTLHLPDLALDPHHATIAAADGGGIAVTSAGTLAFAYDGKQVRSAAIDPETGGELRFGRHRVLVSRDHDGAVLLTVSQIADADADVGERSTFSLAAKLPGKRLMSWLLAMAVLIGFLAVPITSSLTRDPSADQRVTGDAAWSPGPLSLAHHQLEAKCEACHVKPFEAVRDETCLTCHKTTHDHAAPARLASARGPGTAGDRLQWQIAHMFGKPGPGACSDCHTEHEGAARMPAPAQAFCADCHGAIKDRLPDTAIGNAEDFGKLHPQFRAVLPLTLGNEKLTRVSLAANPREASGLTFPHDLHLSTRGGAAQMARRLGKGSALDCASCHRPTGDGIRFLPINMERDCESCHSLAYDRVGSTFRRLRHGDVDQMIADLSVAPQRAAPVVSGRRRPGEFSSGGTYFARFAAPSSSIGAVGQALSRDGICGECHSPAISGGRFSVVPVTQVSRYFQHGWFTHAAHKQEKCASCHKAGKSGSSADVLIPDLGTCRTCHLGEDAPRGKVSSGCAMCHDYHSTVQAPRGLAPRRRQ